MTHKEEEYSQLILEEIKAVKEELRDMRKEQIDSVRDCSMKRHEMGKTFICTTTFWKVFGFIVFIVGGSYGYTTFIYNVLQK